VTHEPRRGLTVTRPDHQQVVELYVMREVLEGAAARLAAQHASETEIAAMAEIVEHEPVCFGDGQALAQVNQRLHGCSTSPRTTATCCAASSSLPPPCRCCRRC
jgi:DNA-binding GntR family transcriptional regulator